MTSFSLGLNWFWSKFKRIKFWAEFVEILALEFISRINEFEIERLSVTSMQGLIFNHFRKARNSALIKNLSSPSGPLEKIHLQQDTCNPINDFWGWKWNHYLALLTDCKISMKISDFNQLSYQFNILDFCVGWAWVIFKFKAMILGSQSLIFRELHWQLEIYFLQKENMQLVVRRVQGITEIL